MAYTFNFKCVLVKEKTFPLPDNFDRKIDGPEKIFEMFRNHFSDMPHEEFIIVALNSANRVVGTLTVSTGILNASLVHPREVFRFAFLANAASIVLVHNHPSGEHNPSSEDRNITKRLVEAGKLLDVPVLDHVIVGDHYYSFREAGMI